MGIHIMTAVTQRIGNTARYYLIHSIPVHSCTPAPSPTLATRPTTGDIISKYFQVVYGCLQVALNIFNVIAFYRLRRIIMLLISFSAHIRLKSIF